MNCSLLLHCNKLLLAMLLNVLEFMLIISYDAFVLAQSSALETSKISNLI